MSQHPLGRRGGFGEVKRELHSAFIQKPVGWKEKQSEHWGFRRECLGPYVEERMRRGREMATTTSYIMPCPDIQDVLYQKWAETSAQPRTCLGLLGTAPGPGPSLWFELLGGTRRWNRGMETLISVDAWVCCVGETGDWGSWRARCWCEWPRSREALYSLPHLEMLGKYPKSAVIDSTFVLTDTTHTCPLDSSLLSS